MTPKSCKTEVKHTNNRGEVCTKTDPTITEAGLKSLQNDKGYSYHDNNGSDRDSSNHEGVSLNVVHNFVITTLQIKHKDRNH